MKKISSMILAINLMAITVLSAGSCTKNEDTRTGRKDEGTASLQLNVAPAITKTITRSDADDKKINTVCVAVFDQEEKMENFCQGTVDQSGVFQQEIKTSYGSKKVYVVCNGGNELRTALSGALTLTDFKAIKSKLDKDNTTSSFLMYGYDDEVNVQSAQVPVDISVKRLVSRIEIHKITNGITALTDNRYAGKNIDITGIYLTNVAAERDFSGNEATSWYNKLEYLEESEALCGDIEMEDVLPSGQSYVTPHYFYCYPNPCSEAGIVSDTWTGARRTRLVIEAVLAKGTGDEALCYYSLELPDTQQKENITTLESNKTYSVTSCTITRKGTANPWENVSAGSITLTVTVTDWETGASYEYTI